MSPYLILGSFLAYTLMLFIISWITGRKSGNEAFFVGNKVSPWYVVAYGMIGASLSGVTFISIPGDVGASHFSYMVIVFGYLLGYIIIANILLPLYYKLNLTSIYTYLEKRFGFWSYKTGAFFFLISRIIGASFRMYLIVEVLHLFVFDEWGVPFAVTVVFFIILIMLYTIKGGIKTIVWTDTLQTTFMLLAVIITFGLIAADLNTSVGDLFGAVFKSDHSKMFFTEWIDRRHFLKQFFSGVFIAIVMTGLDQDMMQKNLSCRNIKDAKKNMYWMGSALVPVNFLFLTLGAILFLFAASKNIQVPGSTDDLFPTIALKYLSPLAGVVFIIGLISAAYSSADSALTALTTSFSVDFLRFNQRSDISEKQKIKVRYLVHIGFAMIITSVIIVFKAVSDSSVIQQLFTIAGYTYGPLLGLFAFGLFTNFRIMDKWVPIVALISPIICYILSKNSVVWFSGYNFGFELLIVNGLITFIGLLIVNKGQSIKNNIS